jgi:hypothetical protein
MFATGGWRRGKWNGRYRPEASSVKIVAVVFIQYFRNMCSKLSFFFTWVYVLCKHVIKNVFRFKYCVCVCVCVCVQWIYVLVHKIYIYYCVLVSKLVPVVCGMCYFKSPYIILSLGFQSHVSKSIMPYFYCVILSPQSASFTLKVVIAVYV